MDVTQAVSTPSKPEIGSPAPQFTAPVAGGDYPDGTTVSLSDLAGQTVVLYFYPKDSTPGCTTQACDLRDNWGAVSAKAKVFGVSPDSVKSHRSFIEKQQLPFPLLADTDKKIVNAYGVWIEKSMMGRLGFGTERTTFVIGPDQKIKAVFPKVKPKDHVAQLLAVI